MLNGVMARVLLSLPDDFLAEVDELAAREKRSRSELVREALRRYLHQADEPVRTERGDSDALGALESIQRMRMNVQAGEGPSSEEWIRNRRERNERLRS